eukprot:COSAG02_NODE_486_length_21363_cov_22.137509_4_plen_58_part_00
MAISACASDLYSYLRIEIRLALVPPTFALTWSIPLGAWAKLCLVDLLIVSLKTRLAK